MERKNYSVVLTHDEWEKIRPAVKMSGIQYYPSEYGESIHISLSCTNEEREKMEKILETI